RPEHRRATLRFWREQRAEAALRERVLVPAEEYERLERALKRAVAAHRQREDERIQEMAAAIREAEHRQRETVRAALEVGELYPGLAAGLGPRTPAPLTSQLLCSRDSSQDAEQPGPSGTQTGPNLTWTEPGQALTFTGHQEAEEKGNVHTGAKPPWLTEEEDGSRKEIGPSYEEFLKQKEKQKLKKLPAERVGANFDHTSETGAGWLPSFGRVWNHGRRWQSR
ncbi:CCD84 protein, partial [Alopecoenas beccarii]|nr:CCD84 protein [Alopecoenas beccarii]